MARVSEIARRLLQSGTEDIPDPNRCPAWPPDAFAVAATLANLSGCYSKQRYLGGEKESHRLFDDQYRERVLKAAQKWQEADIVPPRAEELWGVLVNTHLDVCSNDPAAEAWWDACLELISITDEASVGIGFLASRDEKAPFPGYFLAQYRNHLQGAPVELPYLPTSLCARIDPSEACVLPKTTTAQVGATLRSLTHNLALLPPRGEVTIFWHVGESHEQADLESPPPLNLLLVPFPYRIDGNCFQRETTGDPDLHFFSVAQKWVSTLPPDKIYRFVKELIERAKPEVGNIGGVVLPELALSEEQAEHLALSLRPEGLEFLVAGVLAENGSRNGVYATIFHEQKILREWTQFKHHRWKLDGGQIKRYHLGHALDPTLKWWENIKIDQRECYFFPFRGGASLCALVCEDLARIDPVQVALRSVGPNLVIAILMDGPQLESRWPSRYATVLADDPGSAVLTLTSFGMVQRSFVPGRVTPCPVAMWKDPSGNVETLELPRGSQALVLTLSHTWVEQTTLDGRTDGRYTARLLLTGIRSIKATHPADWVDLGIGESYP
jgi:hypothetical protein